ncbi:TEL2 [Candida pseudojiufengensis]|uniref:TEL2 n=1 Tax=Candida pseudojiufengensis TaxID=497109 RepID=UPI002224DE47|nr:TEL2 [Candida pseudojiufengensis]KAI5960810.1 TEL2 [Candida pseudojiufengensis]
MINEDVEILKNYPSLDQLKDILQRYPSPSFSIISALLNYTIPQIYKSLPNELQQIINSKFQTLIGFGNLISIISNLKNAVNSQNELILFMNILQDVVNDHLLSNLLKSNKQVEIREIDKLLFKGQLLSVVNEIVLQNNIEIVNPYLKSTESYFKYLINSVLKLYTSSIEVPEVFIHSILNFSKPSFNLFFQTFFQIQNWDYFLSTFDNLKSFQKKEIIKKFYTIYLITIVKENNIIPLFNILGFTNIYIDENLCENAVRSSNRTLLQLISIILTKNPKIENITLSQIKKWSDPIYIKNEPISIQESRTFFIAQLLAYQRSSEFVKELTKNKICLEAISNRLSSFSNNVKALGVILADYICELNGDEKIFKSTNVSNDFVNLIKDPIPVENMLTEEAWSLLSSEKPESNNTPTKPSTPDQLIVQDIIQEDNSDDEDGSLPQKSKIPDPIYIKDLLEYLNVDTKNSQAYEMRRSALNNGPTLLRQKFRMGNEVEFYSKDLLSNLIGLDNFFNDSDFQDLKLVNLVAIIVTNPQITFYFFELLLTGDYSLQQRLMILSATSLAARELRGLKDDIIVNSYTKKEFATKKLPTNLHNKYMQHETNYLNQIENNLQNSLMEKPSIQARDEILGKGKLVRISKSLTKKSNNELETNTKPIIPNFFKIIGTNFFFPLLNVWYESGIIDIGHYSTIFIAHYLKTLTLLIHVSYPSSTQLNDMIKEYLLLSCIIIKKISPEEIQVLESIITGILLIFDINEGEYLIRNYDNEILLITTWLSNIWESIIDDKIKSLAAGLLLKLQDVTTKFERTLIDQNQGLY